MKEAGTEYQCMPAFSKNMRTCCKNLTPDLLPQWCQSARELCFLWDIPNGDASSWNKEPCISHM